MKLLVLIHRLPCPPDRGSVLRADTELRWLAGRHEVWCAGLLEPCESPSDRDRSLSELRGLCRNLEAVPLSPVAAKFRAAAALLAGGTATEKYFASRRLERTVMQWTRANRFDAVMAFSSSMAPLALRLPAARRVLDMVDVDSRKWLESARGAAWPMRWLYRTEGLRLARQEREWMAAMDATILVNQREADLVTEPELRRRVHVIEMAMPVEGHGGEIRASLPAAPIVGFVGAMDYPPNIEAATWFADAIWPRIRQRRPDAEWWIVGRSPHKAVRRLEASGGVRVTGTVPALEPYLEQMRVSVAPLRLARGVQTKVLAAMAAGRPAVVTSCVAAGIGAREGEELVVADAPEPFADAVVDLLSQDDRAGRLGRAARRFVQQRYNPAERLEQLEALLRGE